MRNWLERARYSPYVLYVPLVVLCAVALNQMYLVRAHGLPAWKGGGFGMFATIDRSSDRFLRIYLVDDAGNELPVRLPPGVNRQAFRAETLPHEDRLAAFARALAARDWTVEGSVDFDATPGDTDVAARQTVVRTHRPDDAPGELDARWQALRVELWAWAMAGEPLEMQPHLRLSATAPLSGEVHVRDE